jgi:hypothetical protein
VEVRGHSPQVPFSLKETSQSSTGLPLQLTTKRIIHGSDSLGQGGTAASIPLRYGSRLRVSHRLHEDCVNTMTGAKRQSNPLRVHFE